MIVADVQDFKTLFWIIGDRGQIRSVRGHFLSTKRTVQVAVTHNIIGGASSTKSLPTNPTFALSKPDFCNHL
jgi:hypothetical protein